MNRVFLHGLGAVSPAGWGVKPLLDAVLEKQPLPLKNLKRPGWTEPLLVRQVPLPAPRPAFLAHPRLRRSSPIAQYAVGAALEALGADADRVRQGALRLGVIFCAMSGCVNYSRRFYDETLCDPATASPLIFPETVFNAPSSHLAAVLDAKELNYTLVGDPGTFLQGIALAADWLDQGRVDGCLIVGAEEIEWLVGDAYRLISPEIVLADGAGALYLSAQAPDAGGVELKAITSAHLFFCEESRHSAAAKTQAELSAALPADFLCDGLQGIAKLDAAETKAWAGWSGGRASPKRVLGEGLMAAAAWQCVVAAEALRQGLAHRTNISVVGCNEQAIGAQFGR